MKSELEKYKHYLVLLLALIVANYIVMPLSEWQSSQQQTVTLLEKKLAKTKDLLHNSSSLDHSLDKVSTQLKQFEQLSFIAKDEASFKLVAQEKIEKALAQAACKIERIGFKGNTQLRDNIERWSLEIRYKGDAVCLVQTTRLLESMKPIVKIDSYNVNHRGFTTEATGSFNARLNVSVWFLEQKI